MSKITFFFLLVLFLFMPAILNGAEEPTLKDVLDNEEQSKEAVESTEPLAALGPTDDYNRGAPRSSLQGFLDTARSGDFERALTIADKCLKPNGIVYARGTLQDPGKVCLPNYHNYNILDKFDEAGFRTKLNNKCYNDFYNVVIWERKEQEK